MPKIVFDTSAFLNRFFFDNLPIVYTTNSVLEEIKNREQKQQVENLIQNGKIKIEEPSQNAIEKIKKKFAKSNLSNTDLEVLSLALDLGGELHTDDFMIRKAANILHIPIEAVCMDKKRDMFYENILQKIEPAKKELTQIKKIEEKVLGAIIKANKKLHLPLKKVLLAGSAARGTFIRGNKDLDFFLLFDLKLSVDEIKQNNWKILQTAFPSTKFVEEYGEHPYLKASLFDVNIDFVPGFFITDIAQRKSAVDRTPLHLKYLERLDAEKIKEIILLKQFLKNNLLYGADHKNNGLPGYLVELFMLKYNTFENVLKAISEFPKNNFIIMDEKQKVTKKFNEPFVFIDPVDSNRNVGSAVSKRNWKIFAHLARKFLERKSEEFFFNNIYNEYAKIPQDTILIRIPLLLDKTEDAKWGILKSILHHVVNELNNRHFPIEKSSAVFYDNTGYLLFWSPLKCIVHGPPTKDAKNAKAFKSVHKNAEVRNGWLCYKKRFTKETLLAQIKKTIRNQNPQIRNVVSEKIDRMHFDKETEKRIEKDLLVV